MALYIPADHYQVLLPFQHSGLQRSAAVTFAVRTDPGVENPENVADDVLTAFSGAFRTFVDAQVTVGPAVVSYEVNGARGSISGSSSFVGGAAGRESVPPNTAVIIRKNTGRLGRPGRGRMFVPWLLSQTAVTETGLLLNVDRQTLQGMANQFLDNLAAEGNPLEMVILHDEAVPGGPTPSLVTGLTVDPRIGTQRRRNR